jgi:hypothetical protein
VKRGLKRIVLAVVGAVVLCAGCEPKVAVFDMAAIDSVHKLLVLPLASSADPSAGPITSGMISARLATARYERFHIVEAPALWRLGGASPGPIPQATAVGIAKQMGAHAVLTGAVGYAVALDKYINFPGAELAKKDPMARQRLRDFAARKGKMQIQLRIISAATGKDIYVHSAKADGLGESKLIRKAAEKVLEPLEKYLRGSKNKRKEPKDEKK